MPTLPDSEIERALVIVAHPDDAEFWAGGTIALWTGAGIQVTYCILTDGGAGGFDTQTPRTDIPHIRRAEQHEAAALLGVSDVRFLGLPEDALQPHSIRHVRPQRILTWSPEWNWQRFRSCHPNHLATGAAALTALYPDAGNPFALPHLAAEGLPAWTVTEAWLLNSPARETNHYVDITETFGRKADAVAAHRSQVKDPLTLPERLRDRIAANTAAARLPEGRIAEAFQIVITG